LKQYIETENIPENIISEEDDEEIDERRLFYVAMTRAKKKLYLNYSKRYYNSDNGEVDNEEKLVSKFVLEAKVDEVNTHKELIEKHTDIVKILLEESKPILIENESKEYLKSLINEKLTLSASKLNKYEICKYKFLLEDIFHLPTPKSINMILGTIIHGAIEKFYYLLKDSKSITEIDLLKIQEYAVRNLDEEIANLGFDESYSLDKAKEDIQKILEIYFKYIKNQKLIPKDIEKNVYLNYKNIKLSGRIDLILENDFGLTLVDFKTSQKIPSITDFLGLTKNSDKSHLRQLLFYKLLIEENRYSDKRIQSIRIEYIDTKNEEVKIYELPSSGIYKYAKRSNSKNLDEFDIDAEFENFKIDLKNAHQSIKDLQFERTTNLIQCRYCPFKDHCGR
jgi:DNA helicase-2/ATP-dependent DNA helicase PcrA